MMSEFNPVWRLKINSVDYSSLILANLSITSGRTDIYQQPRKLTDDIIKDFTFIKLNENEYKNNTHLNPENIIITLGAKGASFKDSHYPSPKPQETIDVSGAGDTFTSSFIITYFSTGNVGVSITRASVQLHC